MSAPAAPELLGLHHVTGIASDAQSVLDFHCGVLGMRLVKRTVNFDDPGSYHFYFGDETGRPGTLLTHFAWPGASRGRGGPGQAVATAFSVPHGSLPAWRRRLERLGITSGSGTARFGEDVLVLTDADGARLELVASGSAGDQALLNGLDSVTLCVRDAAATTQFLTESLGFRAMAAEGERYRLELASGGPGARLDVVTDATGPSGRTAAGSVHHVALRAADDAVEQEFRDRLVAEGIPVSAVMDRDYFRSIYFREPGGVLIEIATDPPGFTRDEPLEELGRSLRLPAGLESRRAVIESRLPQVVVPARSEG